MFKKIFSVLLVLVFILSLSAPSYAAKKKKTRHKAAKKIVLKKKAPKKAKKPKTTQRKKTPAWIEAKKPVFPVYEKTEVVPAPPVSPAPVPPPSAEAPSDFQVASSLLAPAEFKSWALGGAGYGGGAVILSAGYELVISGMDLIIDGGLGIGSGYYVVEAGVANIFPTGNNYVGVGLSMVDYSSRVADVLGVSGTISKGTRLGLGVFAGTNINSAMRLQAGFNSALGLTVGGIYKF